MRGQVQALRLCAQLEARHILMLVWVKRTGRSGRRGKHARRVSTGYLDARVGEANERLCIHVRLVCRHAFMLVWLRQTGWSSCCGVHAWLVCGYVFTLVWVKRTGSSGLSLSLSLSLSPSSFTCVCIHHHSHMHASGAHVWAAYVSRQTRAACALGL